jgi:hypothetical protein
MKHNVHLYAVVRVKVSGIEADSHEEAIEIAEQRVDMNMLFDGLQGPRAPDIEYTEYADEITEFLVDEEGDEENEHSDYWKYKDGKLVKVEGENL